MLPTDPGLDHDGAADGLDDELTALRLVVRRVLASRLRDPHDLDDLVQETLARVVAARAGIQGPLEGYAVTTARNLLAEQARRGERARRHAPRLAEPDHDDRHPDEDLLRQEDRSQVGQALARLPAEERALLLAHEVDGETTADLARRLGGTPGAVAAQLARTRARMRVEYLLVREHVDHLPTERCRPTLLALSLGERRRIASAGADEHLVRCAVCARLAPELRGNRPGPDHGDVRIPVARDADVVTARQRAREAAAELGFSATEQTMLATAVSELARNIVKFAERGEVVIAGTERNGTGGIRVVARDAGPGIPDVAAALQDGWSTYGGLGLGLPGTRRLVDELEVDSEPGVGTTVTMTKWRDAGPAGEGRR